MIDIETKGYLIDLLKYSDKIPGLKDDLNNEIYNLYLKYKSSIIQKNEEGIEEGIPAFIFVYGTHGNGNASYACSPELSRIYTARDLGYFGSYQHKIGRVRLTNKGDCYIIVTTEQLREFAEKMEHKYRIPMRGAERYPYIALKLTNDQLMRLNGENIATTVSFHTEKGEDITEILESTRTGMNGYPYNNFPKIALKLNKDKISLETNDIQIIKVILLLFKRGGVLDNGYRNELSNSIRITNNNDELSISEMIFIAQHILFLMDDNSIFNKRYFEYMIENDEINTGFFNSSYRDIGRIDCSGENNLELKSSKKLKIDIANGICTPSNIENVYRFLMEKCGAYLKILPDLNRLAAKVDVNMFGEDDMKDFMQICPRDEFEEIRRISRHKKDLYCIIQILGELQDQDIPIILESTIQAVRTAMEDDPFEKIFKAINNLPKPKLENHIRKPGGWEQ